MTAFTLGSILFFIVGCLCGRFYQKDNKVTAGTADQCHSEKTQDAPYYDDVVLKQYEQNLELEENVANMLQYNDNHVCTDRLYPIGT